MNYCNLTIYTLFFSFYALFSAPNIEAAFTDQATGQTFPDSQNVHFDGKDHSLAATGVATRKKFIVKIYSVAHYMEDPPKASGSAVFDEIFSAKKPKRLYLKWVRNVSSKQMQDGYRESFNAVVSSNKNEQIQGSISKFIDFMKDGAKKGDSHLLTWLPDGTIQVSINNQPAGSIKNPDFAFALWSIWFGTKSVVNRNDLISFLR